MSSSNDDDNDGLAALFGGVTPSTTPPATPPPAFESRRAAREAAQAAARDAATSPGSVPGAGAAPVNEPPSFEPPSFERPVYEPPSFEPPISRPSAEQRSPAVPPGSVPRSYDLPPPVSAPPVSAPPVSAPPVYVPQVPPAYDLPAPAAAPVDPPRYPGLGPAAPASTSPPTEPPPLTPPPVAATPVYGAPIPATPGYDLPAPASEHPVEPEPLAEPPASAEPPARDGGFEALGLATPGRHPDAARRAPEPPPSADPGFAGDPAPDGIAAQPLVRAESPPGVPVRVATEPLLPSEAAVETPENLERSTLFEKVGLALAVLTGPIGLGLAIFSAVRSGQRRGWIIGLVRASVVVGVLSTIATVIAGVILWDVRADQLAHDEVAAASAEFCAVGAENPALVTPPTLGWPAPGDTITDSLALMREWTTRWTELAPVSPDPLSAGLEHLAAKGEEIIAAVEQSRIVDDATSQAVIGAAATSAGVASWYESYCAAP